MRSESAAMFKYTVNTDTFGERIKHQHCPAGAVERRITTEQILQLCRILAEQSKNKSPAMGGGAEESSATKEIQSEDITSSRTCEYEYCDRLTVGPEEAHESQSALSVSNGSGKYLSSSVGKAKQAKKDILNKIRNQIFERKRQKLATLQRSAGVVWRPW